jgi:ribosome-binding protein aMBF1 (putative translation factor)
MQLMSCEQCQERERELIETTRERDHLQGIVTRIEEALNGQHLARRPRRSTGFVTTHGRLIAAAATAKSVKLSALSTQLGYAADYVTRVCRGDIRFTKRAAIAIGQALGLELVGFTDTPKPFVLDESSAPAVPGFLSGPCACDQSPQLPLDGEPRVA